ncbi:FAD-dependent oxidoreductase [Herbidospora mongoliensis]|uniref:FAD-dependent oxidoreductase n=1 Tax=Herbidospora mongoliensis TaxID=688067 RepID=UPI0008359B12|nr:FAD-dependent monooxygenase [Herbidospora mongoliensis]
MSGRITDRALVLGGSIAGLFAARVLSETYTEVIVVDRDALTGVEQARQGVPQGRQVHGLLARGRQAIEELFPGITGDLVAAGAGSGDVAGNLRWYFNGVPLARDESGMVAVTVSRPMLEFHVRQKVQDIPNVRFLERHDILGVTATADAGRITGARVREPDTEIERELTADLVVDATGRGSRTPVWLTELGYQRVAEDRLKIGIGYTTRHYRIRTDPFGRDISINVIASPTLPRGAICGRHGNYIELTAYGVLGDVPPSDPEGFAAFLASLAVPDIAHAASLSEPVDDPVSYQFPANLRRRYERLDRFPDGFVLLGDSVCSFNPTYAQGMTIAALGALALRSHLRSGPPRSMDFLRELARDVLDGPWDLMTTGDLTFPGVPGERTFKVRMAHGLVAKVLEAATRDGKVASAYLRVAGLLDPPEALMKPAMLLRILRGSLGRRSVPVPAPRDGRERPARELA